MMRALTRKYQGVHWVVALVLVGGLHAVAQSPIDVVSIRENPSDGPNLAAAIVFSPGRLKTTNLSVEDLVAYGYNIAAPFLRGDLIVGWPKTGIQRKRFDIQATLNTSGTLSAEGKRRVVLELLETRFGFKAHSERRLFDGYAMTLVKPDVLGPALKRVDFNCADIDPAQAPKDESGRSACRRGMEYRGRTTTPFFHGSGTIDTLAFELELTGRHLFVNETGLQGFFVWDLDYGPLVAGRDRVEAAVREHLGIKLESKRVPTDVVVIDDVRMPTPN